MLTTINEILAKQVIEIFGYSLALKTILLIVALLVGARLVFWLFQRFLLKRYFKRKNFNVGRQFAVTSLIKYLYYFILALLVIQIAGIKLSVVWAAGAALLVGAGIGLQQTFNDFASGLILLIEGSVEKGDWLKLNDMEGKVERIGFRTSQIRTRRDIAVIVPNSKITVDNVVNYSHSSVKVRYSVTVSVAYGSDVKMVKELLLKCGSRHNLVIKKPEHFVRFIDFGDSGLYFELLFWCEDFYHIEDVKSDLRFMIDNEFRTHNIRIPFPQRDLHLRSNLTLGQDEESPPTNTKEKK